MIYPNVTFFIYHYVVMSGGPGGGTVPIKTMNAARFYLLLLALFILPFILNAIFLAQTISEINTKQEVLKIMAEHYRVTSYLRL